MADTPSLPTRERLQALLRASPVTRFLQIEIAEARAGDEAQATLVLPMRAELERIGGSGQFQGGYVATLVDTAGVYALLAGTGLVASTINFSVDYLRPATGASISARATVRRAGKTVATVDVEVTDEAGKLCALGRCCYSLAQAPSLPPAAS
jgi:uncharacterized protein (TIGR00369 family)